MQINDDVSATFTCSCIPLRIRPKNALEVHVYQQSSNFAPAAASILSLTAASVCVLKEPPSLRCPCIDRHCRFLLQVPDYPALAAASSLSHRCTVPAAASILSRSYTVLKYRRYRLLSTTAAYCLHCRLLSPIAAYSLPAPPPLTHRPTDCARVPDTAASSLPPPHFARYRHSKGPCW